MVHSLKNPKKAKRKNKAEQASGNYIGIFKLLNISGKKRDLLPGSAYDNGDDANMDSESSSDEKDEDEMLNLFYCCSSRMYKLHKINDTKALTFVLHGEILVMLASCMIASGGDDGTFSIRDLRLIKGDSLVVHFEYHKQPITSIERSPHEASTVAVSSADNQLTIWDLSLERDEEEEAEFKADENGSECAKRSTNTASFCSSGTKGLEGVALALSDPWDDHVHSC